MTQDADVTHWAPVGIWDLFFWVPMGARIRTQDFSCQVARTLPPIGFSLPDHLVIVPPAPQPRSATAWTNCHRHDIATLSLTSFGRNELLNLAIASFSIRPALVELGVPLSAFDQHCSLTQIPDVMNRVPAGISFLGFPWVPASGGRT